MAKALVPILESADFDAAEIAKDPGHRVDNTEICYFRDPQDKADAARILELVAKQTGRSGRKIAHASDPDNANGSRKFEVWFDKSAAVVR